MVTSLIFDLDDTLCDYQQAMENAKKNMTVTLESSSVTPSFFWEIYHELEPGLFRQFVKKKLTIEEYRFRRFADVLREFDIVDTQLTQNLNVSYMNGANHNIQLFADTLPFLRKMKERNMEGVVLTNGPSDGQHSKIAALGLRDHLKKFYISTEIGYSKPMKEAFQYVLDDLQLTASEVLMIGDSIEYDIEGAERAGIQGILLDRYNKNLNYNGLKIRSLLDLLEGERHILWQL